MTVRSVITGVSLAAAVLVVDVSIAQATLALLALWRPEEAATEGNYEDLDFDMDGEFDDEEVGEPDVDAVVGDDHAQRSAG